MSNDNKSINSNRYHVEKRINKKHPEGYYHTGTDIAAEPKTKVQSVLNGIVVDVRNNNTNDKTGYGNTIVVKSIVDGKEVYIFYGHLENSIVKVGNEVKENQIIAVAGATGNAYNVNVKHVHVEAATVMPNERGTYYGLDKYRINPEDFFDTQFDKKGNLSSYTPSWFKS